MQPFRKFKKSDFWAKKVKRIGGLARYSLRIIYEAKRANLPLAIAFALVDKESGFRNIFGCDHGNRSSAPWCNQRVTKERVQLLLKSGYANGVGFTQITYRPFVQEAEKMGGAHKVKFQLRVGFNVLSDLIKQYGKWDGIRRYNGSGPLAEAYANDVLYNRVPKWRKILR